MKAENLSNEDLAAILRSMCVTGICPSRDEKEYLQEAADRLEQEPKTGYWINNKCTNCEYIVQPWNNTNYCPNCGAKMVEPQESEDKK